MDEILIVEDDANSISYLSFLLKRLDIQYKIAPNGVSALKLLDERVPRCILMDISLGEGMSGFDLCGCVAETSGCEHIPIVAMSAHITEKTCQDYLKQGFTDCLKKPFSMSDLKKIVDKYLS